MKKADLKPEILTDAANTLIDTGTNVALAYGTAVLENSRVAREAAERLMSTPATSFDALCASATDVATLQKDAAARLWDAHQKAAQAVMGFMTVALRGTPFQMKS